MQQQDNHGFEIGTQHAERSGIALHDQIVSQEVSSERIRLTRMREETSLFIES